MYDPAKSLEMREEVGEIGVAVEKASSPTGSGRGWVSIYKLDDGMSIAIAV